MPLKFKFFILFLLISIIPLVVVGIFMFQGTKSEVTRQIINELEAIADVQKERINEVLDRYLEQVELFTSRTQLRLSIAEYVRTGNVAELARIEEFIINTKNEVFNIDSISILDVHNTLIASTDTEAVRENRPTQNDLQAHERVIFFSDIFKDENNVLKAQLFGPFILEGEVVGIAEIIMSAAPFVAVSEDYTGLGKSGEVYLTKKNSNGDAVFLTPLRFDGGAALRRAVPKDKTDVPTIPAISGQEEVFSKEGIVDYRGAPIFAVTRFVESLGWGIVVKIDRDEVLAPVSVLTQTYLLIVVLSILFIIFASFFVAGSITKPITLLTQVASQLEQGQFTKRADVANQDEIGLLARAFNSMAEKLQGLYEGLEKEVEARTEELKEKVSYIEVQNKELESAKSATLNILEDLDREREKLAQAKAKDEAMLASIGEGLVFSDLEQHVVLANRAAESMLGWKENEMVGKKWLDIVQVKDKNKKKIPSSQLPISKVLQSRPLASAPIAGSYMYTRKDDSTFPVVITASPVIVNGEPIGAIIVFRDITKEEEIDKAKTEFVSLASHQLRTPLSTVNWYVEMLLAGDAGKINAEQKKYLGEVYHGNQRMVALINSLLNVSRLELGTFVIEPVPTNIARLAESVIEEQKPQIKQKKIACTLKLSQKDIIINIDEKMMRMVFENLLSNAVKYTPEKGTVKFIIEQDAQKKRLLVKVEDTGYGIPERQQDKMFTKLFRADNVRDKSTEGTGLGLYIAKSIIEHSGGKIWFESTENKGTTFYVALPLEGMKKKEGTRLLT